MYTRTDNEKIFSLIHEWGQLKWVKLSFEGKEYLRDYEVDRHKLCVNLYLHIEWTIFAFSIDQRWTIWSTRMDIECLIEKPINPQSCDMLMKTLKAMIDLLDETRKSSKMEGFCPFWSRSMNCVLEKWSLFSGLRRALSV